ncbi:DgyrCDS3318 [Dimorphilus gyrociliatus]|uniref:DgyrCDS3318 n=1 Tax=Dimorphilus gyrociliatus TaxID=2664684 RepID=A0A7I8VHY4_9ANNE|nr:DgyrCDS3318 [Dimorphilus gyrociliatus]
MENLQTEVLQSEFEDYARGKSTITEENFAKILLRYTVLSEEQHDEYLNRLRKRITSGKGIDFKAFKDFCQFLNNLDDFAIAMRIYTYSEQPISESEFRRAVKISTGHELDFHVVHTVFQLFDVDGDNQLSHNEFITVMKDRVHRGFRSQIFQKKRFWENFKGCVRREMKHS